jgi:hypothetical protein
VAEKVVHETWLVLVNPDSFDEEPRSKRHHRGQPGAVPRPWDYRAAPQPLGGWSRRNQLLSSTRTPVIADRDIPQSRTARSGEHSHPPPAGPSPWPPHGHKHRTGCDHQRRSPPLHRCQSEK